MNSKTYQGTFELKSESEGAEPGEFKAVFATLNVIDHDGDVTVPGAFSKQQVVIEGWNHDYGIPVGKGLIDFNDDEAWIDGKFLLTTTTGRDHYEAVKALQGVSEWSYTFSILKAEDGVFEDKPVRILKGMDVSGVAPVTRGAGLNTRTLIVKAKGDVEVVSEDEAESGKSGDEPTGEAARTLIVIQIEQLESEDLNNG